MKLLLPLLAAPLLCACISTDNTSAKEPFVEREYPTGSNLPRRANSSPSGDVSTMDRDALERMRDAQIQQHPAPAAPGGPMPR